MSLLCQLTVRSGGLMCYLLFRVYLLISFKFWLMGPKTQKYNEHPVHPSEECFQCMLHWATFTGVSGCHVLM